MERRATQVILRFLAVWWLPWWRSADRPQQTADAWAARMVALDQYEPSTPNRVCRAARHTNRSTCENPWDNPHRIKALQRRERKARVPRRIKPTKARTLAANNQVRLDELELWHQHEAQEDVTPPPASGFNLPRAVTPPPASGFNLPREPEPMSFEHIKATAPKICFNLPRLADAPSVPVPVSAPVSAHVPAHVHVPILVPVPVPVSVPAPTTDPCHEKCIACGHIFTEETGWTDLCSRSCYYRIRDRLDAYESGEVSTPDSIVVEYFTRNPDGGGHLFDAVRILSLVSHTPFRRGIKLVSSLTHPFRRGIKLVSSLTHPSRRGIRSLG
jgi:hypothetical protein